MHWLTLPFGHGVTPSRQKHITGGGGHCEGSAKGQGVTPSSQKQGGQSCGRPFGHSRFECGQKHSGQFEMSSKLLGAGHRLPSGQKHGVHPPDSTPICCVLPAGQALPSQHWQAGHEDGTSHRPPFQQVQGGFGLGKDCAAPRGRCRAANTASSSRSSGAEQRGGIMGGSRHSAVGGRRQWRRVWRRARRWWCAVCQRGWRDADGRSEEQWCVRLCLCVLCSSLACRRPSPPPCVLRVSLRLMQACDAECRRVQSECTVAQ